MYHHLFFYFFSFLWQLISYLYLYVIKNTSWNATKGEQGNLLRAKDENGPSGYVGCPLQLIDGLIQTNRNAFCEGLTKRLLFCLTFPIWAIYLPRWTASSRKRPDGPSREGANPNPTERYHMSILTFCGIMNYLI